MLRGSGTPLSLQASLAAQQTLLTTAQFNLTTANYSLLDPFNRRLVITFVAAFSGSSDSISVAAEEAQLA